MPLDRTDFVGTVFDGCTPLLEFIGEGKDHVVYRTSDLSTGKEVEHVIKFRKPCAFLEMSVLHHRFLIHPAWPNHRLRLDAAERRRRLHAELIERIQSRELAYRCTLIDGMYRGVIPRLIRSVRFSLEGSKSDESGNLGPIGNTAPANIRAIVHRRMVEDWGIIPLRDEVLQTCLEGVLEAGGLEILDELIVVSALEVLPQVSKHSTVAGNSIVSAIGLLDEDFISEDEFGALLRTREFAAITPAAHTLMLRDVIKIWVCMLADRQSNLAQLRAAHAERLQQLAASPVRLPRKEYESGLRPRSEIS